ncbi:MAG: ankyrin repeat domain-containing protein, partial [Clostridia bacterium]
MKLVKEHINKFERGLDPKAAMGTGVRSSIMKFLEEKGELTDEIGEMSAGFSDSHLLIYCCKYGKTEWVKFLIDQGANVNTGDSIPLEWAVIKEYNDIINILLKAGAKPYSHKVNFTKIKKSNKKDNFTLGESINFERGLDPKDAMDTGAAVNILGNEPGSEFKVIVLQELTDMEKIHV